MGQASILTTRQTELLRALIGDDFIRETFYLTGGTALAEAYLHHRISDGFDFFTPVGFDPQRVLTALTASAEKFNYTIRSQFVDPTNIYILRYADGTEIKTDFSLYPYPSLANPTMYRGLLRVDSLLDIAVNKIVTMTQRTEVKDFVDLYFLLKRYTFWDRQVEVHGGDRPLRHRR